MQTVSLLPTSISPGLVFRGFITQLGRVPGLVVLVCLEKGVPTRAVFCCEDARRPVCDRFETAQQLYDLMCKFRLIWVNRGEYDFLREMCQQVNRIFDRYGVNLNFSFLSETDISVWNVEEFDACLAELATLFVRYLDKFAQHQMAAGSH